MKRLLLFTAVIAGLAIAPIAAAGSSVLDAYGTNGSKAIIEVKGAKTSAKAPITVTKASGVAPATLPFTGMDIMVLVVSGAGLVFLGGGLRRLGRDKA